MSSVAEAKSLIVDMCANFYSQGWVGGTGGGISIRIGDKIVMAPSGVQKERMRPEDMFVLDREGNILETPEARPPPYKPPKLSECSSLFMAAYNLRGAGAVIHSHSIPAMMATMMDPLATEFRCTHLEMIKGIAGHTFHGGCVVPIIENTARECELTERLEAAIKLYPQSNAVLVRRHGVYVWGADWIQAKTQAECYDYLFDTANRMRMVGLDAARPPVHVIDPDHVIDKARQLEANGKRAHENGEDHEANGAEGKKARSTSVRAVVLDIEGTVAPITFVSQVLFPYARDHVQAHLEAHYGSEEAQSDIQALRALVAADLESGTAEQKQGLVAIPAPSAGKEAVIKATVASVQALIRQDRKAGPLKDLQGHVWRGGFQSGKIKSELYEDTVPALKKWSAAGLKVYIYSSGSREAQRLLFGHTSDGDVRRYLSGFFDTAVGVKVEAKSYKEIALSLGVDESSEIVFATDSAKEAEAAVAAGWRVCLVDRPGNNPLPAQLPTGVQVIKSMDQLLTHC